MPEIQRRERIKFFTICASNYIAQAAVLGRAISDQHDGARLTVFLLDRLPACTADLDHLDIAHASETMQVSDWHHRQCFYDLLELATSVKPACVGTLLDSGHDLVVYLDPDIVLFRPLSAVLSAAAAGSDVVLTPHILTPLPPDGRRPDDLTILRAGIYNLGFVAFANTPGSRALLTWWSRHLHLLGGADIGEGIFTDQKWMNFAPAFLPAATIVRDPGYNVAYWNLHERTPVRSRTDGWRVSFVDGSEHELAFFHFSGFSPRSEALSKHENRFGTAPPGETRLLLQDYGSRLAATGLSEFAGHTVAPPAFEDGARWDWVCRSLYREVIASDPDFGDPLRGEAFLRLAAEHHAGDHLPRYLRAAVTLRPDLAQAFDDGRNRAGLLAWLSSDGVAQLGVDPTLLSRLKLAGEGLTGVNYAGYFRSHLGIAEAARNAVSALEAGGLDVELFDVSHLADSPTGEYEIDGRRRRGSPHGLTILGVNADETLNVLARLPEAVRGSVLIGYWAWETPEFPEEWCNRFDTIDEVWVPSAYVAEAVRAKATVPVAVIPYAVPIPDVASDRAWLSGACGRLEADEFVFVSFFDVGSIPYRKNPIGAIEAFRRAFPAGDEPVRLVVKVLNGHRDPRLIASLAGADRRITVWDAALDAVDRFRLLASVDALVSLHRAEGFGLSIAEAMGLGKPVVVTNWSGNTDFTTPDNAALVAYELVRSDRAYGPYPAGTLWGEPDLDDAARQIRRVWQDADWRGRIGAAAAATISTKLSPDAIGGLARARLERVSSSARRHARTRLEATGAVRLAAEQATTGIGMGLVLKDISRRPAFYLARSPRLPQVLIEEGFASLLDRLVVVTRQAPIRRRRDELSLRRMLTRLWRRLQRRQPEVARVASEEALAIARRQTEGRPT